MSSDNRPEKHGSHDQDHDVATLIRAAGPRAAVPGDRLERVRAAAHETWRLESRRASRRRQRWIAGALAAAATLILAIVPRILPVSGPAVPQGFTVESLSGEAWATPSSGEPGAVALGARFALATEVRTADTSRLALRLESGHSVRLDHSTRVRVMPGGSLTLEEGAIYVDSESPQGTMNDDRVNDRAVTVYTPFGRIEEVGTQFEVRLNEDAVHVRLREGAVILRDEELWYPVAVGTEFSLSADGSTATVTVPPHDAAWNWAATVAPVFDLEGRTARTFLDWIARERGLQLVFADAGIARSADEVILAGQLQGVSVDQALDAVLPTCRMSHRIVDGILMIDADPDFE